MFFDSWTGLGRVLLVGTLAYVALVLLLRISGKRTLTKLNAFDLVVTVALGSTLATVLLSKSVALAEGVVALALLVSLQYAIALALGALAALPRADQGGADADPASRPVLGRRDAPAARHPRGDPGGAARARCHRGQPGRGRGAGDRRLDQRRPGRRGRGDGAGHGRPIRALSDVG